MFGRKKPAADKTALILDIESGSVGSALARLGADGSLKLVGEWRKHLPIRASRSAESLAADIEKLVDEALPQMSRQAVDVGGVSQVNIFLSPPWGAPNLTSGRPDFVPYMQESLMRQTSGFFESPPQFYTHAGAATQAMRALSPYEDNYLLCIVTHEMTELLLIHNGAVAGHATIPHGIQLPLRTLRSHGNLSDAEARSLLRLGSARHAATTALDSANLHYAQEFKAAARELFDLYAPDRVWVVSPMGEYFARALSHPNLADLFPQGGVVRALNAPQVHRHAGSSGQDLFLILDALYLRYTQ